MTRLEEIAAAALDGDALKTRGLAQDLLANHTPLRAEPAPDPQHALRASLVAGFAELFALRNGEAPPDWASAIGPAPNDVFLVRASSRMPRLRRLCEAESPEPLRKRRFYVPGNYLVQI